MCILAVHVHTSCKYIHSCKAQMPKAFFLPTACTISATLKPDPVGPGDCGLCRVAYQLCSVRCAQQMKERADDTPPEVSLDLVTWSMCREWGKCRVSQNWHDVMRACLNSQLHTCLSPSSHLLCLSQCRLAASRSAGKSLASLASRHQTGGQACSELARQLQQLAGFFS